MNSTIIIHPSVNLVELEAALKSIGLRIAQRNGVAVIEPVDVSIVVSSETNAVSLNSLEKLFTFFEPSI